MVQRIDITARIAAQRVLGNPSLRGQPLHVQAGIRQGTRLFVSPKPAAGTGDALRRALDRSIRFGFKFEEFSSPQVVPIIGARVIQPGITRQPILGAELASLKKFAEQEKQTILRRIERTGKTLSRIRQETRELKQARDFFKKFNGPVAIKRSNVQTVANTSAALKSIGRSGISRSSQAILARHAQETGLGKINADFISGRLSRERFFSLVSDANKRAKDITRRNISRTRSLLLRGDLVKRVDSNLKKALSNFENLPKATNIQELRIKQFEKEQDNINKLAKAFEKDSIIVDKRIQQGLATGQEISALSFGSAQIFNRQKGLNSKINVFNAQISGVPRAAKVVRKEDIIGFTGDLTFDDVTKAFVNIPSDASAAGRFLGTAFKTQKVDRRETVVINGKRVRKIDLIGGIGATIGGALSLFQAGTTLAAWSVQERFKNVFPSGQVIIPTDISNVIRGSKAVVGGVVPTGLKKFIGDVSGFLITDPLKFVKVENGKYIITSRAAGETARAAIDVVFVIAGGRGLSKGLRGIVVKVSKTGNPIGIVGSFRLTGERLRTSFFNKLKVKNFKELASRGTRLSPPKNRFIKSFVKIPEFRAVGKRVAFEVTGVTKQVGRIAVSANEKIAVGLNKLSVVTEQARIGVQLTKADVVNATDPIKLYLRELNNIRKTAINQRISNLIEIQSIKINKLLNKVKLPTFFRKGSFTQFQELKNLRQGVLNSIEKISTVTKTKIKPITTIVKKASKKIFNIRKRARTLFDVRVSNQVKNLRADYKTLLRELKQEKKKILEELDLFDRKKIQPRIDKALFPIEGRLDILERYLKARKNFTKFEKEFNKKAFREVFLKDLKSLEDSIIGKLPEFKTALRIVKKEFDGIVKRRVKEFKLRPSVVKGRRIVSRINNVSRKGLKDIEIIFKAVPQVVKKKLTPFRVKQRNRMIRTRNGLIKRIKGKKLTKLEKLETRQFQQVGFDRLGRDFENAVKKAVKDFKRKEELFNIRLGRKISKFERKQKGIKKFLERRKEARLKRRRAKKERRRAKEFRKQIQEIKPKKKIFISNKEFLRKQRVFRKLSGKGFVKLINEGKFSEGQIKTLINNAQSVNRITSTTAKKLREFNRVKGKARRKLVVKELFERRKKIREIRFKRRIEKNVAKIERGKIFPERAKRQKIRKANRKLRKEKVRKEALDRQDKEFIERESKRIRTTEKQVSTFLTGFREGKTQALSNKIRTAKRQAEALERAIETKKFRGARLQRNIEKNINKIKGIKSFPNRFARRKARRERIKLRKRQTRERVQTIKEISLLEKQGLVRAQTQVEKNLAGVKKEKLKELDEIVSRRLFLQREIFKVARRRDLLRKVPLNPAIIKKIELLNVKLRRLIEKWKKTIRREKSVGRGPLIVSIGRFKTPKPPVIKSREFKPKVRVPAFSRQIQIQKTVIVKQQAKIKKLESLKPVTKTGKAKIKTDINKRSIQIQMAKSRLSEVSKAKQKFKAKVKLRAVRIIRPRIGVKLSESIKTRAVSAARVRQVSVVRVRVESRVKQVAATATRAALAVRVAQRVAITPRTVTIIVTRIIPRLRTRVKQAVKLREKLRERVKLKQKLLKRIVPLGIPIPSPQTLSFSSIARLSGPLDVVARIRGNLRKINPVPLSGSQALAFGGFKADNKAIRSFGIVKGKGRVKSIKVGRFTPKKFRKPVGNTKLQRFLIVEKVKFAIDTPGEKREITRKGLEAKRLKRKKKKVKKLRKKVKKRRNRKKKK